MLSETKSRFAGKKLLVLLALLLPFLFLTNLQAQQWSAEQKEVWKTIDAQWQADKDGKNWVEEFLHPDCIGWNMNAPMPRSKDVTNRWFNAFLPFSKTVEYQITPLAIVLKGNIAMVHYYYLTLSTDKEGKPEREKGRWTEVWIKEGNKWLCLGWQGGADKNLITTIHKRSLATFEVSLLKSSR